MSAKPRTSTRGHHPTPRATLDRALELVRQGWTMNAVADVIGYSSGSCISSWRKQYPWFAAELDAAKAEGLANKPSRQRSAQFLALVRAGLTQRAALRDLGGLTPSAVARWKQSHEGFAVALTAAIRAGRMVRYGSRWSQQKAAVLTWLERGQTVIEACRRAGCSTYESDYWRTVDAGYAADYARLVGPTHRPRGRAKFRRLLVLVREGETVWNASRAVRLGPCAPHRWRDRYPEMWAEVVKAYGDSGREPPRRRVA